MPHSGVLATILSGLEPAVAIGLACIPLMRPLFSRRQKPSLESHGTDHTYSSNSKSGGFYFRKASKNPIKDPTSTFSELYDETTNSSQVELRMEPLREATPAADACVAQEGKGKENWPAGSTPFPCLLWLR